MDVLLKAAAYLTGRQWARWQSLSANPQEIQNRLLLDLVKRNRATRFGRDHGFGDIHSLSEYRKRVLIGDYERVRSYVEGTVDFIFGGGTAVFNASTIYEKRASGGPITAAKTDAGNAYGFLFYKSTINGAAAGKTQLGRPWGADAQVLYRESSLSATIATAQPWIDMSSNSWKKARFTEYRNTGSGATTNGNRPQLPDSQAANYTPQKYLAGSDGWNPIG